ncbi:ABC transporter ATP-binding protein [Mesorhizobium abyssinicae]|uniref:ABC transporter ATP-binding protein n=1 Tax=Mesorhizobium abyssinicae TaxID=1209958 RepID=UPI003391FE64
MQLIAQGLVRRYGNFVALNDVNIGVEAGEFLTLLGPSGSGKTTFLNIVAGFTEPTSGKLLLGDNDITCRPPENRNFGMVFQGYALFPNMTVSDNIGFPLRVRKWSPDRRKARVSELLDRIDLAGHSHKYPRQLSGGQQQRVALARALSFSPEILLLDEPLSALDLSMREQLQVELKKVHEEFKTTFIFVTHDQSEALAMSTRIAIFNNGEILQVGKPHEVYTRPSSRFVAEFLGHFNLFPIRDAERSGDWIVGNFGERVLRAPSASFGGELLHGVRPENVFVRTSEPEAGCNGIRVRILGWSYRGSQIVLSAVSVAGPDDCHVRIVMPSITWNRDPGSWGEIVWLSWAAENSIVLPKARTTSSRVSCQ